MGLEKERDSEERRPWTGECLLEKKKIDSANSLKANTVFELFAEQAMPGDPGPDHVLRFAADDTRCDTPSWLALAIP